jgi:GDP-4-dehydro-6-deoxy-D-mannose reductase
MRALITGISGFVGGHLAEHVLDSGDEILGCSPDGTWTASTPEAIRRRVEVLGWDLARDDGLGEAACRRIGLFRPEAVYHLAAISVPKHCGEDQPTPEAVAINVEGTRRVLELVRTTASSARVLFVSSCHVYAPVPLGAPRVAEDAPLGPVNAYGRTKLAAEAHLRAAARDWHCEAIVVRAFQHAGPGQGPEMMLSQWARQLARPGPQPLFVQTRDAHLDLTDVRDVVRAYRLLIQRAERGGVYNVGSGINRRSGDVVDLLREIAGSSRPIVELRPGPKQDPIADVARLMRATGWRPAVPLEQTVSDTLAWWRRRVAGEVPNSPQQP